MQTTIQENDTLPSGTKVKFLGYEDGDGDLKPDSIVTIVDYDVDSGLYNVKNEKGIVDSLYDEEFTAVYEVAVAAKPISEELEFVLTPSVQQAISEAGNDVLEAAHTLAEREAKTAFTLGGILASIKRSDMQVTLKNKDSEGEEHSIYDSGLGGFNAYVGDVLGLHERKAHTLVSIYEKFSCITTEEQISKIGWTKLRELLPLDLDKENVTTWLAKANDETTSDLKESVRKELVDAGEEVHGKRILAEKTSFRFVCFEDQAELWKSAIAKAKYVIGEDESDSAALNHIITEWCVMSDEEGE